MNTIQRGRLLQLIKQHFPFTEPCDVDHALQWEIIAETLNALGPSQTIDEWIEDWESIKYIVKEKLNEIKLRDEDICELPEDLKLSEEDHRVIKICGFEEDSDKMAELVKLLDCRAISPFQNESYSDADIKDESNNCIQEVGVNECLNDIEGRKVGTNVVAEQLEEQKKINGQLAGLLAALKLQTESSEAI